MNLETINIKDHFIRMGLPNLIEIIGKNRIDLLLKITNQTLNETSIADLIIESSKEELFSDSLLRGYVIHFLPNEYKSYLEFGDKNQTISQDQEKILIDRAWNRKFKSHSRLLEIFNLPNEYLPSEAMDDNDELEVLANKEIKELSFWQKIVQFIKNIFFKKNDEYRKEILLIDFQNRVKKDVLKEIKKSNQKILIHMPTGSGKTRTALTVIIENNFEEKFLNENYVIWVAHSDELCDQAKETFKSLWEEYGDHDLKIIRLKNQNLSYFENQKSGFIITTYQKIHQMKQTDQGTKILEKIRDKAKFIICDEAHMVPAETFMGGVEFINKLDYTKIIGLSATPGGYYEEITRRLSEYFNSKKISITDEYGNEIDDPIHYLQERKILAKLNAQEVATNFEFHLNQDERDEIINQLQLRQAIINEMEKDEERNICILAELRKLYNENYNTIVFACSLEHAKLLYMVCVYLKMKVGIIHDKTRYLHRKKIIEKYKKGDIKIIFNYGVLSTGFDAPNTNSILIARPTTSPIVYSQMLGRGLRGVKFNGNESCLLIDMKDNLVGLPDERRCFTIFNKYYNKH